MHFQKTTGYISVIAASLGVLSLLLWLATVDFNITSSGNLLNVIEYPHNYKKAYWFLVLDLFGYYLLLIPIIFYVHQRYKSRSAWASLITFCGGAYVITGCIGAITLATAWPILLKLYAQASPENYEEITILFSVITVSVFKGLWNILGALFAAVWFTGSGILFYNDYKAAGLTGIVTGIGSLANAMGNISSINIMAETGVFIYLFSSLCFVSIAGFQLIKSIAKHK